MKQELTEKQIQEQVIQWLRYNQYYVMRLNSGMIRSSDSKGKQRMIRLAEVGTPDVMAFREHLMVEAGLRNLKMFTELLFFEIKRPGNKPTRMQEIKMQELEEKGAKCFVIHSVDELEKIK